MSTQMPYVGFGNPDDPTWFAYFSVEITRNEDVYPDWAGSLLSRTRQIAGSSNLVTQVQGHGPDRLTLRLHFDTRRNYRLFRWYYGKKATLSLVAGFTSHEGESVTQLEREYERFTNTFLEDITDVQNRIGGGVECTATFLRAGVEGATW